MPPALYGRMSSPAPSAPATALSPGRRVRLVDISLFVTIVPYQVGDPGTILGPCAMSGLWWVTFDREPDNPIRLPASAVECAGEAPAAPAPDEVDVDVAALLDDLEPVPVDDHVAAVEGRSIGAEHADAVPAVAGATATWHRSAAPLDPACAAAPVRQPAAFAPHAGDVRLARTGAPQLLRAFDTLH